MSVHLLIYADSQSFFFLYLFYVIFDVRACPQRKSPKSMLKLDYHYQSSYIRGNKKKWTIGQHSDNRIDKTDHLTRLLISCVYLNL